MPDADAFWRAMWPDRWECAGTIGGVVSRIGGNVCRVVAVCTELGDDPAFWPTRSPLRVKRWFNASMDTFVQAVGVAIAGAIDAATKRLFADRATVTPMVGPEELSCL